MKSKSKFGEWLKGAIKKVPDLAIAGIKLASGNLEGAFKDAKEVLSNSDQSNVEVQALSEEFKLKEMEWQAEVFALEVDDRKSGRKLYSSDSVIQKIFAIVFLIGYIFLSYYLIRLVVGLEEIKPFANTILTMVWTGTTSELNTIVDFFFGGSVDK